MIQLDIPMPDCCYDCPFSDDSGDYPYCRALRQNRGYSFDTRKKRFPNCPLKPVEEHKETENKSDETDKLKDLCRILFNRCRAVGSSNGVMCVFCGMKDECEKMHSI